MLWQKQSSQPGLALFCKAKKPSPAVTVKKEAGNFMNGKSRIVFPAVKQIQDGEHTDRDIKRNTHCYLRVLLSKVPGSKPV